MRWKLGVKRPVASFILLTNIIFWPLFLFVGLAVMLHLPTIVIDMMLCIASWSSTVAFLLLFKRIYPGQKLKAYVKNKFRARINFRLLLAIVGLQVFITILTLFMISSENIIAMGSFTVSSSFMVFYYFFKNLFAGPLGEELGWRGFAQSELQKKYPPFIASIIVGFWWGLWHFPIWLTTGYTGSDLVKYIVFFMIAIISISTIMATFYNLNHNLVIPIIIHQLFNFLMSIIHGELIEILRYHALLYLILAILLIVINPRKALYGNKVKNT